MKLYRVIDANINRVSEGLRVLEDIGRFIYDNKSLSKELRQLRHLVRKSYTNPTLLTIRDSENDIGFDNSQNSNLDSKNNITQLVEANFKRTQEGLRCIEELLKLLGFYKESKIYETIRFSTYALEKQFSFIKVFPETDLYGILGEEFSNGRSNIEVTKELVRAGIKIIQYREKDKNKLDKYKECEEIRKITYENKVTFIVNDDIDIALSVNADGIHIGQQDLPIEIVKKLAGNLIIGLSTHNKNQAIDALKRGADYIGVGPIYKTSTKKNVEKCDGLDYIDWVSKNINIPYVAIGGIKETNIAEVKKHGGKCFAMVTELVGANNIPEKVENIRNKIN